LRRLHMGAFRARWVHLAISGPLACENLSQIVLLLSCETPHQP